MPADHAQQQQAEDGEGDSRSEPCGHTLLADMCFGSKLRRRIGYICAFVSMYLKLNCAGSFSNQRNVVRARPESLQI